MMWLPLCGFSPFPCGRKELHNLFSPQPLVGSYLKTHSSSLSSISSSFCPNPSPSLTGPSSSPTLTNRTRSFSSFFLTPPNTSSPIPSHRLFCHYSGSSPNVLTKSVRSSSWESKTRPNRAPLPRISYSVHVNAQMSIAWFTGSPNRISGAV